MTGGTIYYKRPSMRNTFLATLCLIMGLSSCRAQETTSSPLNGKWFIEVKTDDLGTVRSFMTFAVSDTNLTAMSTENADRKILGYGKSVLGRAFSKSFENGALLHIKKSSVRDSTGYAVFKGILTSAAGNFYIFGKAKDGVLDCVLKDGAYTPVGSVSGTQKLPQTPLDDYVAIVDKAIATAEEKIYNRDLLATKYWKNFKDDMREFAPKCADDVELIFAFFYHASKLPFSHFSLLRKDDIPQNGATPATTGNMQLEEKARNTAYLKISSFAGGAEEADSIMHLICAKKYDCLVIDLRDNTGGNVAPALTIASYLTDKPLYGGVFLTQKWFAEHKAPPAVSEYKLLPEFSKANYDLIIEGIHKEKGLVLKIEPAKQTFRGKVYILTNGSTASTCEPFAYGLQQYGIAQTVGKTTAGAMLNAEFFNLGNSYKLVLPTADYYTADGYKIDKQGVKPDVDTDQPLEYVLSLRE